MGTLTPRQRLLAAIRCQPVDRLPVQLRGVRVLDDGWVAARHSSYAPLIEAVRALGDPVTSWHPSVPFLLTAHPMGTPEVRREPHSDTWDRRTSTLHTPRGPLTSIRLESRTGLPGMTRRYYVDRYEQLAWIQEIPYVPPRPDVAEFLERSARIGERGLLLAMVPTAVSTLQALLGTEGFALAMMDVPDLVLNLLWAFQKRVEDLIAALLAQGVGPVFGDVGAEVVGPPIMSPRLFRQLYAETERRTAKLLHAHGALLHVHCHGSVRPLLDDFVDIGVDVLHPVEAPPLGDTPLPAAKAALGGHVCFEGNVQIGDIYERSPAEFAAIARRAIGEGAPGGGFILCPTASPYTPELPPTALANYLTLLELGTAYRYGS